MATVEKLRTHWKLRTYLKVGYSLVALLVAGEVHAKRKPPPPPPAIRGRGGAGRTRGGGRANAAARSFWEEVEDGTALAVSEEGRDVSVMCGLCF